MFYSTWRRLQSPAQRRSWHVEPPRVLDTTPPLRPWLAPAPHRPPRSLAITALALSRRHLIHLTCLLSLILLAHLLWSRRRTLRGTDNPWSRLSEWRRTAAITAISLVVTIAFTSLKAAAHAMGLTRHYDLSYSDIIIATLFFQFSLYVCVRLARRGFTLGELGLVCYSATGLFMECVNLTRSQIRILQTPFIKTYRTPDPLLVFQLALVPGSLLTGFLLSPLLVLSRRIAQRPVHRLRFPAEKDWYRKLLAAGFYSLAAIICGGVIGTWARWCLDWRDPFVYVILWITRGTTWWARPALIGYWATLASISVAGWTRQLSRARKHRSWMASTTVNGQPKMAVIAPTPSAGARQRNVATQVMDGVDHRLPTLSVNARRKFFHALAVVMFVPGILMDPAFTHVAFSVAFALFTFAEYVRYFALYPFGAAVHLFLNEFLDGKDSGTAILSHFYLLTGCASAVWLGSSRDILNVFGALALGIGDALASIVGRRYGRLRWSTSSNKTVEGSLAFFASVLIAGIALRPFTAFSLPRYAVMCFLCSVMEALSEQNDNLILPIWSWCLGVLMEV